LAFKRINFSELPSLKLPRRGVRTTPPNENKRSTEAEDVSGVFDLSNTFKTVGNFFKLESEESASLRKFFNSSLRPELSSDCSERSVIKEYII